MSNNNTGRIQSQPQLRIPRLKHPAAQSQSQSHGQSPYLLPTTQSTSIEPTVIVKKGLVRRSRSFGAASLFKRETNNEDLLPATSDHISDHSGRDHYHDEEMDGSKRNKAANFSPLHVPRKNSHNNHIDARTGNWNRRPPPRAKSACLPTYANMYDSLTTETIKDKPVPRDTASIISTSASLLTKTCVQQCAKATTTLNCTSSSSTKKNSKSKTNIYMTSKQKLLVFCSILVAAGLFISLLRLSSSSNIDDENTATKTHSNIIVEEGTPPSDPQEIPQEEHNTDNNKRTSLRQKHAQLKRSLTNILTTEPAVTTLERLEDPFGPASAALDWLVDSNVNPQNLSQNDIVARFALACLFFATHTTGSQWIKEEHWMQVTRETARQASNSNKEDEEDDGVHVCDWYGITCAASSSPSSSHVTHLNLTANQLQGTLPDEFWKGLLANSDLVLIDLSHNQLWGTLPSKLPEGWGHLDTLYLDYNAFTGMVPEDLRNTQSILQHTNLKHVKLHHNHLMGLQHGGINNNNNNNEDENNNDEKDQHNAAAGDKKITPKMTSRKPRPQLQNMAA